MAKFTLGNLNDAQESLELALALNKMHQVNHKNIRHYSLNKTNRKKIIHYIDTLENLALVYMEKGDVCLETIKEMLTRAASIRPALYKAKDHYQFASTYINLAMISSRQKNTIEQKSHLKSGWKLLKTAPNTHHTALLKARVLAYLSQTCAPSEAGQFLQQARDIYLQVNPLHPDFIVTLLFLSRIPDNVSTQESYLTMALSISEQFYGDIAPQEHVRVLQELLLLYYKNNEPQKGLSTAKRAYSIIQSESNPWTAEFRHAILDDILTLIKPFGLSIAALKETQTALPRFFADATSSEAASKLSFSI